MQLLIKNGLILQNNGFFLKGQIAIEKGKIASLSYNESIQMCEYKEILDAESFMVSPGFIDTHNHGGSGFGYIGEEAEWEKVQERLCSTGVTSLTPTWESSTPEKTLEFIDRIKTRMNKNDSSKVDIVGIHWKGLT